MSFNSENVMPYNGRFDPVEMLVGDVCIAPMWADLTTGERPGDDVYVFQPDPDSIGFRWQAVAYYGVYNDYSNAIYTNFEVILYRDGFIRFNYGSGTPYYCTPWTDFCPYGIVGIFGNAQAGSSNGYLYENSFVGDDGNGDSISFFVNNWNMYAGPFAALGGVNTLYYYTADTFGNTEPQKSQTLYVDTTVPVVSIVTPQAGTTNDTTPALNYRVSEYASTVTVMVDNQTVTTTLGGQLGPLSDGPHTVRVDVTDEAGHSAFAVVTFTVDTVAPAVSISSPAPGASRNRTPQLLYTVSSGTVVVKVDGVVVSKVNGDLLDSLSDGNHTVLVHATSAAGNVGSAQVRFRVDNASPTIRIASPVAGVTNLSSVPLSYSVSDGVVTVSLDGSIVNVANGGTLINLSNGSHYVSVSATDKVGNTGIARVDYVVDIAAVVDDSENIYCSGTGTYVVGQSNFAVGTSLPPPGSGGVIIDSPHNDAQISGSKIIVKGAMDTIVPVSSVLIVVTNGTSTAGYLAQVNGQYFAAKIPVTADTNSISAIATDQNGVQHQTSVSVTVSSQTATVDLLATPSTGIPMPQQSGPDSLIVNLTSSPTINNTVARYTWDFGGSNAEGLTCYSHSGVKASYEHTGLYLTRIAVTDVQGNIFMDTAIVNVMDRAQMDDIIKPIWNAMRTKLGSRDVEGAMSYFNASSQNRYRTIFNSLNAQLPEIAQNMQEIQLVNVNDSVAKYRIRKNEIYGGQMMTITYYIYFRKDSNGSWFIDKF